MLPSILALSNLHTTLRLNEIGSSAARRVSVIFTLRPGGEIGVRFLQRQNNIHVIIRLHGLDLENPSKGLMIEKINALLRRI